MGPLTQPGVDITQYVSQEYVADSYNRYITCENQGHYPTYNPVTINSNTWADALLLSATVSQSNIDAAVATLSSESGLTPTGYINGQ